MGGEAQQGDRIREEDLRKKMNREEETGVWFSVFFDALPLAIPTLCTGSALPLLLYDSPAPPGNPSYTYP